MKTLLEKQIDNKKKFKVKVDAMAGLALELAGDNPEFQSFYLRVFYEPAKDHSKSIGDEIYKLTKEKREAEERSENYNKFRNQLAVN